MLRAHLDQPIDRRTRVVGVNGREDQVACHGGLDGNRGSHGRGFRRPGLCPGRARRIVLQRGCEGEAALLFTWIWLMPSSGTRRIPQR